MTALKKAPYFTKQAAQCEPFNDWLILIGEEANRAYYRNREAGKGMQWQMISDAYKFPRDYQPVILDSKNFAELDRLQLAPKGQRFIKIFQAGAIPEAAKGGDDVKTRVLINLAANNPEVVAVEWLDNALQGENLTPWLSRIKAGDDTLAEVMKAKTQAQQESPHNGANSGAENGADGGKVKMLGSSHSDRARAFYQWLGLRMARHSKSKKIHSYNGKVWELVDEEELGHKLTHFFDENQIGYSSRTISGVIDVMRTQIEPMGEPSGSYTAFNNGDFNRQTFTLEPHSPEHWLTALNPIDYQARAESEGTPNFDKWLEWVSDEDPSKARNIMAALYAIFTNRHNWQLFIEITGEGGSGKSVFAEIAAMLVGEDNTGSTDLHNLDDSRKRASIYRSRLIICPDQSKYTGDGSGLKGISGGDLLEIDPKHETPFMTMIRAMILLVNNRAATFTERAGGIERRRVIFAFNRSVPAEERDYHLREKIRQELSGVVQKLLKTFANPDDALIALQAQMHSAEALEVKEENDHITDFCRYLTTTEEINGLMIGNARKPSTLFMQYLYSAYLAYIDATGQRNALTLRNFTAAIKQGLRQQSAPHDLQKKRTSAGYKTNVHYKDVDEFKEEFIKTN